MAIMVTDKLYCEEPNCGKHSDDGEIYRLQFDDGEQFFFCKTHYTRIIKALQVIMLPDDDDILDSKILF